MRVTIVLCADVVRQRTINTSLYDYHGMPLHGALTVGLDGAYPNGKFTRIYAESVKLMMYCGHIAEDNFEVVLLLNAALITISTI